MQHARVKKRQALILKPPRSKMDKRCARTRKRGKKKVAEYSVLVNDGRGTPRVGQSAMHLQLSLPLCGVPCTTCFSPSLQISIWILFCARPCLLSCRLVVSSFEFCGLVWPGHQALRLLYFRRRNLGRTWGLAWLALVAALQWRLQRKQSIGREPSVVENKHF